MNIGVQLHPQGATIDQLRTAWQTADAMGVDSLWVWDHFFPLYGDPDASHFEGWSLLAAMAVTTQHAKFGAMVTCNSYRNPELLADMARTVDHLSGGRLILGLGSGWFERDYSEYGYEFGTAPQRLKALGEAIPRMKARLAKLNPAPLGELPILIGGGGEKVTLRLVARHAQMWNGFGTVEELAKKNAIIDEWCAVEGTDPLKIERTTLLTHAGTADELDLASYANAGIDHVMLGFGPPFDLSHIPAILAKAKALPATR
jgi:probable F420-dependent oxidoreductase